LRFQRESKENEARKRDVFDYQAEERRKPEKD